MCRRQDTGEPAAPREGNVLCSTCSTWSPAAPAVTRSPTRATAATAAFSVLAWSSTASISESSAGLVRGREALSISVVAPRFP